MHRHACGHGHYWDCDGSAIRFGAPEPSQCMCLDHGVPMENGDHSQCTIELLECPVHQTEQVSFAESDLLPENQPEDDWKPIQMPDNLEEMFKSWVDDPGPNIGWCLMCNSAIRTENDLIPGTYSHNCAQGRAVDAKIRESHALQADPGGTPGNE